VVNQKPRSSLPSSRCSQENAGIKEKPHRLTLRGVALKVAMSASSRAIHRSIVALGMSRMGIATAGCKKRPPSHSSTRTMGLLSLSRPNLRRSAGGSVREPRLLSGIVVAMQQCCIVAMRDSSVNRLILPWSAGRDVGTPNYPHPNVFRPAFITASWLNCPNLPAGGSISAKPGMEAAHADSREHALKQIEALRGGVLYDKMGRPTGLEPATPRFTKLCALCKQTSYKTPSLRRLLFA
jgi:hypothetical protein